MRIPIETLKGINMNTASSSVCEQVSEWVNECLLFVYISIWDKDVNAYMRMYVYIDIKNIKKITKAYGH